MGRSIALARLFRDLWHRKSQVFILTIVLGCGGAAWFGMSLMNYWREYNIHSLYQEEKLDDGLLNFPNNMGISRSEFIDLLSNFSRKDDIENWDSRLRISIGYEFNQSDRQEIFRGYLYGLSTQNWDDPIIDGIKISDGRKLSAADINQSVVVINEQFRKEYDLTMEMEMILRLGTGTEKVQLVGSAASPEWVVIIDPESTSIGYTMAFAIGYVHLETLQNWVGLPDRINEVMFHLKDGVDTTQFGKDLEGYFTKLGELSQFTPRVEMPVYEGTEKDMKSDREMMTLLAIIIFVVALFGLWISLNRLVTHQKREIGIELSLGTPSGKILRYYLIYGVVIGVLGMGFSYLLGWIFGVQMDSLSQSFSPIPNWQQPMSWRGLFEAWAFCLGISFLASWYPARQASKILPIKAMRSDPAVTPVHGGGTSRMLKWFIRISHIGMFLRMAVRNILRSRKRTAATVIGFGLSVGLIIGTIGIFSSLDNVVAMQKVEMGTWDLRAQLYMPVPIQSLAGITNHQDVEQTILGLAYFAEVQSDRGDKVVQIMGFNDSTIIPYMIRDGDLNETGLAISATLANDIGAEIGESVILEHVLFQLPITYQIHNSTVDVVAFHVRSTKIEALMTWSGIQQLLNTTGCANQIYLHVPAEKMEQVKNYLYTLSFVRIVELREETISEFSEAFGEFMDLMWIIEIMCFILAFGVILLTSMITRGEREREIGTMATLGAGNGTILRVFLWEGAILAFCGIILGDFLGWVVLDSLLIPKLNAMFDAFTMVTFIPQNIWINIAIIAMGLALLSQLPLLGSLRKIDIAQATKVRDF